MTTYLIDYENTQWHGLAGIDKLPETDYVAVFIRKGITIPLDAVVLLTKSKAQIVWKSFAPPPKPIPNYLDMQLGTYLGALIGGDKGSRFVIISKDNGFTAVCDLWKVQKPSVTVLMAETIAIALTFLETGAVRTTGNAGNKTTPAPPPVVRKPAVQAVIKKSVVQPVVKKSPVKNEKIPPAIKKRVGEILKSFSLTGGGNYSTVYSVLRGSQDEKQFCGSINKSFSKTLINGKANDMAMNLVKVYKEFRLPAKG